MHLSLPGSLEIRENSRGSVPLVFGPRVRVRSRLIQVLIGKAANRNLNRWKSI